ncbi:MAG: TRAP transporter small permease subunit [Oceanicaulis sp.]|uniref:TRAP transporter small permease subunit n=1 Tax=Glycocaulis sp. TaxID=1969725 RepID=UPI0025BCC324|nr:TRAP transporter small permease subunit [Glycocaulis sp.]MCC5980132.1 TRAP transporter small permease subunit [Oceanicaulis sp.]MCH8521114.1 TRAP transporter small permease subunit [Glycocaulis sp.]
MRAGDWLLIAILALTGLLMLADMATGGGVQGWIASDLSIRGRELGIALGWAGWGLTPVVALPLIVALWAVFASPPAIVTHALERICQVIDAVNRAIGDAVRWFALALVLVTSLIVIQRYVFGVSITKLQESMIYFHALLFLLSSASTLLANGHVRVDIFYSRLNAKSKAWTDIAGVYLALIPMCWLILDTSRSYVGGAWRILERSREGDGLPLVFALKTAIPVFAVMMIAQGVAMAARGALTLAGKDTPDEGLREDAPKGAL